MADEATVKGKDTVLAYGNTDDHTTATTWTPIGAVQTLKPPKRTAPKIDKTVLDSAVKESEPGLPEVGDAELTILYKADRAGELDELYNTKKAWRIRYPGGSGRMWTGWISEDGEDEVVNGDIVRQTIKVSSAGDYEFFESSAS